MNIKKHKYGYYQLDPLPTESELANYYQSKYYQEECGSYNNTYTEDELSWIYQKIELKYSVLKKILKNIKRHLQF